MKLKCICDNETLLENGFSNHVKDVFYLCKRVDNSTFKGMDMGMTLNITIQDVTRKVKLQLIDEADLSGVDLNDLRMDFKIKIEKRINEVLNHLKNKGVLKEYK